MSRSSLQKVARSRGETREFQIGYRAGESRVFLLRVIYNFISVCTVHIVSYISALIYLYNICTKGWKQREEKNRERDKCSIYVYIKCMYGKRWKDGKVVVELLLLLCGFNWKARGKINKNQVAVRVPTPIGRQS